jgi:hypothetical protein
LGPLPLFLVFVLANIGWAIAAAIGSVRKGRWFYLAGPFATLAIWAVMFVWDGLHHGA